MFQFLSSWIPVKSLWVGRMKYQYFPFIVKTRSWSGVSWWSAAAAAKSLQSCPTLCDPIDGSPPDSRVPGTVVRIWPFHCCGPCSGNWDPISLVAGPKQKQKPKFRSKGFIDFCKSIRGLPPAPAGPPPVCTTYFQFLSVPVTISLKGGWLTFLLIIKNTWMGS